MNHNSKQHRLLDWFIRSGFYEMWHHDNRSVFGLDMDSDRIDRMLQAASHGAEGSTHYEVTEDWEEALESWQANQEKPRGRICAAIRQAIDEVRHYHDKQGTLHETVG